MNSGKIQGGMFFNAVVSVDFKDIDAVGISAASIGSSLSPRETA
jgi:hypothetical protein